ncbi:probable cytochrome P450 6a14 [Malaya genurostris]|uniref:probable cytochrome P450 6a14 n=1 Tax=Malaya genurostris TaxID=325434 RepID=UPI0026F3A6BA|nr:probable cytochrome P450 6a14 [Malaya genurostris]
MAVQSFHQFGFLYQIMWIHFVLIAVFLAIFWLRNRYSYWEKRGVPYIPASYPLGNLQGLFGQQLSTLTKGFYEKLKGPARKLGGIYFFINPVAIALDLEFVKDILIKDFRYFHDRGLYYNEKDDPLTAHLLTLEGNKWKTLRNKLTPTFTSGKMKTMFPLITSVAEHFQQSLEAAVATGQDIEVKDFLARYTTDVIGTCAFGLECNSLADPKAKFREKGRRAVQQSPIQVIKVFFGLTFGDLARRMHLRVIKKDVSEFFMNAVKQAVEHREHSKEVRNDFMDLLIKLKNTQPIEGENIKQLGPLTLNEIAAQAFVFFVAGFETSSTAMTFCLYELALNEELQEKARQNVLDSLESHGSMTYEAIYDMKYIENCINESLRKYPPITNIFRCVSNNYQVPGSDIVLEKGFRVMVPVYAIHHDPEYYPKPEMYDPERFNPDQANQRHHMAFIPFGDGPRSCIGLRFGMMQARVGMAYLLKNFRFKLASRTCTPLVIDPSSFIMAPKGGLWLQIDKV